MTFHLDKYLDCYTHNNLAVVTFDILQVALIIPGNLVIFNWNFY